MSIASRANPKVQGRCPACGCTSLFLGDGGYVTCSILGCKDPCSATDVLSREVVPVQREAEPQGVFQPTTIEDGQTVDEQVAAAARRARGAEESPTRRALAALDDPTDKAQRRLLREAARGAEDTEANRPREATPL